MIRYYIIVDGRVQGVGFRFFCTMNARTLDLTGWVRNMDNGMVEMEVQGEENSIEKFIKNIKKGNRFIRVDELYQKKIEILPQERTFTERYWKILRIKALMPWWRKLMIFSPEISVIFVKNLIFVELNLRKEVVLKRQRLLQL